MPILQGIGRLHKTGLFSIRIERRHIGVEHGIHTRLLKFSAVFLKGTRIRGKVLVRSELQGVDKNGTDDAAACRLHQATRLVTQCDMPGVQIAHGRHKSGKAGAAAPFANLAGCRKHLHDSVSPQAIQNMGRIVAHVGPGRNTAARN